MDRRRKPTCERQITSWADTPRTSRMSTVPDYQRLCLTATMFNPVLGLLAIAFNKRAMVLLKQRRERHANVLYFSVFLLSVTSITLTVCAGIIGSTEFLLSLNKDSIKPPRTRHDLLCRDYLIKMDYKLNQNDTNACNTVHQFHRDIYERRIIRRPERNMTGEKCVCPPDDLV